MKTFLIPARGGSKRILGKNLVDLGGHPLIRWTIAAAKEAEGGYPIYVTSDDTKLLEIVEGYGVVPHLRPAHLADDQATMRDVVRQFLKTHPETEDLVLLYPTVPFRTSASVRAAMAFYDQGTMEGPHRTLMSVHACNNRPFGGVQIIDGKLAFSPESTAYFRGQDTPTLYYANGAIYIINRSVVDKLNTQLFCAETVPFIMHGAENIDIDTPFDLELARGLVASGYVRVPRGWEPTAFPVQRDTTEVAST